MSGLRTPQPLNAFALGLLALAGADASTAAPPVLAVSSDTSITIGATNLVAADHQIALDNLSGIVVPGDIGPLRESSDLVGIARTLSGASLLVVDTTIALTGGLVARPGDVVAWDGTRHTRVFDAIAAGVPRGVRIDSVSLAPEGLLLSFDTDVALDAALVVADEDLVRWDGSAFHLAFDGSAHGLDSSLDVDGAQDQGGGTFLLSFDTSGLAGDVVFADEDVVVFDGTTFTQAFDGSASDADWVAADLDAFTVPEPERFPTLAAAGLALVGLVRRRRPTEGSGDCGPGRGFDSAAKRASKTKATVASARASAFGAAIATMLLAASPSLASDGVLEINQTCATLSGCFAGDVPGFPVTIDGSAGSSYLLTGDLEVPNANTDGIVISTNRIALDLNGFGLSGPTICNGSPNTCAPVGSGVGIRATPPPGLTARETTVTNGRVKGFGSYGLSLRDGALVEHVTATENGATGILVDDAGVLRASIGARNGTDGIRALTSTNISGCTAVANGGRGLVAGPGSTILGSTAYLNGGIGIYGGDGSIGAIGVVVADNASRSNVRDGIFLAGGGIARGNTVNLNGDDGIDAGDGALVRDNAVFENGDAAADDGIECDAGCSIQGNVVRSNDGFGLNLGAGSAYNGNTVTINGVGTVSGGVPRSDNYCDGAAAPTCP
ncbi:MAG: right-handed parallel beta-helix repeat-containing protein [Deltaproteobacteria bacterium]|nr:right-handed parallel beta-helix repeat-containing protein [Deltaproteobacteria bacterium]